MSSILRALLVAGIAGCASLRPPAAGGGAPQVNALWNDAGQHQRLGFWLYEINGGCPDLRQSAALPLVFGTKVGQAELGRVVNASDLGYCFSVPARDQMHNLTKCSSGNVELTHSAATNRYSGRYSFVMGDGTKREGQFEAAYCPPASAATSPAAPVQP